MNSPRVLFYVQHLLGIGHVKRAATLARAMTAKGLEVTVVSGGDNVPILDTTGMTFVQLPSVRANDRNFEGLVNSIGNPVDVVLKEKRKQLLLDIFFDTCPHILMIELYPFGRRQLEFELIPLLEAAKNMTSSPRIICSVRDILVEKNKLNRDIEMVDKAKQYFDDILVHGDPNLIAFDRTFRQVKKIKNMLHYTGYVVDKSLIEAANDKDGRGEVIVSSGSGAVGENLLRIAIKTRPLTSVANLIWRVLVGYNMSNDTFKSLKKEENSGLIVERARPDFVTLLKNCHLSISQGGYNTIMEVLMTRSNSISVPYGGGNETEQTVRTKILENRGLIRQISEKKLTVEGLRDAIEVAVAMPCVHKNSVDMDGALKTSEYVAKKAAENILSNG
jgi:predicted glycosyltransferase